MLFLKYQCIGGSLVCNVDIIDCKASGNTMIKSEVNKLVPP